nr:MAG TPA: hypothetical protein [Caudoviricetes sp.]
MVLTIKQKISIMSIQTAGFSRITYYGSGNA